MKKALIVWGGWAGHEPKQCADLFAPLLQSKGFEQDEVREIELRGMLWAAR